MKILILSWRDIKHPFGGGAELLSHEMAKRWVVWGHEAIHFSAMFPGGQKQELIDGVEYQRAGSWVNVHIIAFWKILTRQFGNIDVIIDEVHGFSFFSAIYSNVPVVCLACEVAKEVWDQMYKFPLNILGRIIERIYLFTYKNIKFITISPSTKEDLKKSGIKVRNITVLPMGFSYTPPRKLPKRSSVPTFIFLGRLAKTKGVEDAIKAFFIINQKLPKSKMLIVGRGIKEYENWLKSLVRRLKLDRLISFKGFVSEKQKFKLLASSHLILVPSIREGWGLIVPEANLVGTPAIVYNSPGLRDVTKTDRNGIVVESNTPGELAKASLNIILNKKTYQKMSELSKKYAYSLSWDDTAKAALKIIISTQKSRI